MVMVLKQEKKFEQERLSATRGFELESDQKSKSQKQLVEKTEQQQEHELRLMSKRIRSEQVTFPLSNCPYYTFVRDVRVSETKVIVHNFQLKLLCLGERAPAFPGRPEARGETSKAGS